MKQIASDKSRSEPLPGQRQHSQLLYSRKEVARLFGVSTATVKRLEQQGRLPGIRLTKSRVGTVFFRDVDIDAFLKAASNEQ
jgi:predicted DNA-binding transcriptional regulator AlpA